MAFALADSIFELWFDLVDVQLYVFLDKNSIAKNKPRGLCGRDKAETDDYIKIVVKFDLLNSGASFFASDPSN